MASPRGTNEVERLADLVGPVLRVWATAICARALPVGGGMRRRRARQRCCGRRNVGGTDAWAATRASSFGADASDRISAWRADNGDLALDQRASAVPRPERRRSWSASSVVFGDAEGYVHFLAADGGQLQLRLPTDGSAVIGTPALAGSTILVTTRKGGLFAFRLA